jgi:hypothetical protein
VPFLTIETSEFKIDSPPLPRVSHRIKEGVIGVTLKFKQFLMLPVIYNDEI